MSSFLPAGIDAPTAILLMAAVSSLLTLLAIWNAFVVRDPLQARLKAIAERRAALRSGALAPMRRRGGRKRSVSMMRQVVWKFDLLKTRQLKNLQMKLSRAGIRSQDGPVIFAFCKLLLPLVIGVLAFLSIYVVEVWSLKPMTKLMAFGGALVFGLYAPELYVRNLTDKRKKALRKGLPDALDLLVICAEAGLGMDAAFTRVAREMANGASEIADEFGLTSIELSFLPERRQALINLAERTDMAEFRGVVNTLLQTERYGTPLAQSLRVLSAEFRNERMMRAEEKAARLPATMTVPMIVFIMPCLFIVLLGPAILRAVDSLSKL